MVLESSEVLVTWGSNYMYMYVYEDAWTKMVNLSSGCGCVG